jgi:hypothetical protein
MAAAAAREAELDRAAARVREDIKTATERYNAELMRLDELYQAGRISAEEFGRAMPGWKRFAGQNEAAATWLDDLRAGLDGLALGGAAVEAVWRGHRRLLQVGRGRAGRVRHHGKLRVKDLVDSILQDLPA